MKKYKFKVGDYIKVTPQVIKELDNVPEYFGGEIIEIHSDWSGFEIELDSDSLNSLNDEYLIDCIQEGGDIFKYLLQDGDFELMERRDSDEAYNQATAKIEERIEKLEKEYGQVEFLEDNDENEFHQKKEKWAEEFEQSHFVKKLDSQSKKDDANFVADTFMHYAFNYEGEAPDKWTASTVSAVCLNWVPSKISSEMETFENYGEVLIAFFKFLHEKKYISNALDLQKETLQIKDQIPVEAADSSNWGMAKTMMMTAQSEGYDASNQDDLNAFMNDFNKRILSDSIDFSQSRIGKSYDHKEDPYKNLGRNDRITVKYKDGRILENIKFKKVEIDLKNGNCEWVK